FAILPMSEKYWHIYYIFRSVTFFCRFIIHIPDLVRRRPDLLRNRFNFIMKKGEFLKFLSDIQRRNVYKSALAYIVASWISLPLQPVSLSSFHMPLSFVKCTCIFLALAFPFWLVFSWVYDLTPEGIKKTVGVDPSESITPH